MQQISSVSYQIFADDKLIYISLQILIMLQSLHWCLETKNNILYWNDNKTDAVIFAQKDIPKKIQ